MNKNSALAGGIAVAVILVGAAGYYYSKKSSGPAPAAENNAPQNQTSTPKAQVQAPAAKPVISYWQRYTFAGSAYVPAMSFEYPTNWEVRQMAYTVGVESLALNKIGDKDPTNLIVIGGRGAKCGATLTGQSFCFKDVPVRTDSKDPAVQTVLMHLQSSIR